MRQYYLIRALAQRHHIGVVSFLRPEEERELRSLQELGVDLFTVPFTPPERRRGWKNRWESWSNTLFSFTPHFANIYPIDRLVPVLQNKLDEHQWTLIHFETLNTAPLSTGLGDIPWVMTAQNVESANAFSQARRDNKATYRLKAHLEAVKLKDWERKWVERSPVCVVVSELDKERFLEFAPRGNYFVVPNGVDAQGYQPSSGIERSKERLLFFGNLGYPPNVTGLAWFIDQVYPRIKEEIPAVTLEIVGAHATQDWINQVHIEGIHFTGFVEDIKPALWSSTLCIVPLFSGGGTRLKILEAMAAGLPVVSTTIGMEGLDLRPGKDLLVADGMDEFADAVIMLLKNPHFSLALSKNALDRVSQEYDWSKVVRRLEEVYAFIIDKKT